MPCSRPSQRPIRRLAAHRRDLGLGGTWIEQLWLSTLRPWSLAVSELSAAQSPEVAQRVPELRSLPTGRHSAARPAAIGRESIFGKSPVRLPTADSRPGAFDETPCGISTPTTVRSSTTRQPQAAARAACTGSTGHLQGPADLRSGRPGRGPSRTDGALAGAVTGFFGIPSERVTRHLRLRPDHRGGVAARRVCLETHPVPSGT